MGIRENIIKLRELFGITQEELARIAGVTRGAVSQWEGGFSEPRMGAIQKIADYFHIYKSNIIEENGMDEIDPVTRKIKPALPSNAYAVATSAARVPIKVLGTTHAGEPMEEYETDLTVEIPETVAINHPGCFVLKVEGDCMNKRFPDGSCVVVDPYAQPQNGQAVVAEFEDGRSVLRLYMRGSSTLMLVADSFSDYPDIVVAADDSPVRLVGVIVWFQAWKELV